MDNGGVTAVSANARVSDGMTVGEGWMVGLGVEVGFGVLVNVPVGKIRGVEVNVGSEVGVTEAVDVGTGNNWLSNTFWLSGLIKMAALATISKAQKKDVNRQKEPDFLGGCCFFSVIVSGGTVFSSEWSTGSGWPNKAFLKASADW